MLATAAVLLLGTSVAVPGPAQRAAAVPDDPQVLAQTLLDARAGGRFDSISSGVVERIIAPVARGEEPAPGCRLDTRLWQLLVVVLEAYGTMLISDLARSCPGVAQNPPCPTTYISPHCSNPVRAVDVLRVGGTALRGGAESVPFLRFLDSFVPTGSLAGQNNCGSAVALSFITLRIADTCNHLHFALPTTGTLRITTDPAGPSERVLGKIAMGTPDFTGDARSDVFRITVDGTLYAYPGNGAGGWLAGGGSVGSGWDVFLRVIAPGDFDGDGASDLIGISPDGAMRLYSGNGAGGWRDPSGPIIGTGWGQFAHVLSPGDFDGDAHSDLLAVRTDGLMLLYSGDGAGGWVTGSGRAVGSSWNQFSKVVGPGDFDGDGHADLLAIAGGALRIYTGDGTGGWADPAGAQIGSGWEQFVAVTGPGDFTGDGHADLLGVREDGIMSMYRGNGAGGWVTGVGEAIGSGWY